MFWKDNAGIHSDEGWTLRSLSLTKIKYVEGEREALLPFEFLGVVGEVYFAAEDVADWSQPAKRPMTPDERIIVAQRVISALEWVGFKVRSQD